MTTNILCFGDSNTYGYIPGGLGRYPEESRYPNVLAKILGASFKVSADGIVGRTTCFNDPVRPGKNSLDSISQSVEEHQPDILVLALGTNDCKECFHSDAKGIAKGLEQLCQRALAVKPNLRIILIAPAHLGSAASSLEYNDESFRVSLEVAREYAALAKISNYAFLELDSFTKTSPVDGEHLTEAGQRLLAKKLAELILEL